MRSSAKNKCETATFSLDAFSGVHLLTMHSLSIRKPRYSIHNIERYGERGSP